MRTPRLPPLGALRAFHAVARHRSFKLAAGALGVSATAVSHQIKLLESVLECRVCERSAQGVSLTADGEILYAATQRAFSALEQAVVQIAQARQPPSLTVTTTSNFLTHWLVPRLADFTARFPAIDLRLHPASNGWICNWARWTPRFAIAKRPSRICAVPCCMRIALSWSPARRWPSAGLTIWRR